MIEVTDGYKRSVYATTRKTVAKLSFEILDNEAYEDNSNKVTDESIISRMYQVTNKKREPSYKYATLEKDYFKLDGSFHIPPKTNEGNYELGWWSNTICDDKGIFTTYQQLEFTFKKEHSSMGLTIIFDALTNEYASDFDINVYKLNGTLIHTESIVNNNDSSYLMTTPLTGYGKILITIKKWCNPYRRCRVIEVDFGVVKEYKDKELIKFNIIEQMNIINDTLPSNEFKFVIDNSNKEFNILNPYGFYNFLKERQEIFPLLGVEKEDKSTEYIPMGKYYLTNWQSDEGALTTTFTARDILDILEQIPYINFSSGTLYKIAEDIIKRANIKDYFIDEELKNISTLGFKEKLTSRKALQCIGIASKCAVFQDRYGVLSIKQFKVLDESTSYINFCGYDLTFGTIYPQVDEGYDMKNITFDNVYKEPQIKLDKPIESITIVINKPNVKEEMIFNNPAIKSGVGLKLDNPLINDLDRAKDIADWIIKESNLRAIYAINWRQNPCLECGDIVLVEDSFNAKKQSRIIKQEFEYQGYLGGKTETKGGV